MPETPVKSRELNCLIEGESVVFVVPVGYDDKVSHLKEAIKGKRVEDTLKYIGPHILELYKVNIDLKAQDKDSLRHLQLQKNDKGVEQLAEWKPVQEYWSDLPSWEHLHVMVRIPPAPKEKHHIESPLVDEPSFKRQRREYFERFPKLAPSTLGQPSQLSILQQRPSLRIFCNRPHSVHSTPITLLHPAFGKFVDDCEHYIPDRETTAFVLAFTSMMCEFHQDELARAQSVRDLIWRYFQIKLDTRFITGGHASVGPHVYVNVEGKNELGSTAADPSLQSVIYGHHHARKEAGKFLGCRFPCLHMYFFGPFLGFAGSALSNHMHYEPLSPIIPFWFSRHDKKMFDSVVRLFGAFKNTTRDLRNYYMTLEDDPTSTNLGFPYSTTFTHLETGISTLFKLESQPLPDKLLYTGVIDAGVNIFVKFVKSYSRVLHAHCSSLGSAPPLLGYEILDGGWFMVVMNDSDMVDYRPFSALNKSSLSSRLRPMVLDLVHSFHQQNLVHGDLRDTNILVQEGDGRLEIKLVDLDWGGVEGEVRYPSAINCTDFWRRCPIAC